MLNKMRKRIKVRGKSIRPTVARQWRGYLVEIENQVLAGMDELVVARGNAWPHWASSGPHAESEAYYSPSRARRRHCPGVIPILWANTRRNADTD